MLQLLFSGNDCVYIVSFFIVNQPCYIVLGSKARDEMLSMFLDTAEEVICYSDVESSVLLAGEDINVVGLQGAWLEAVLISYEH